MVERWIREIRDSIHSDDLVADSILSALGYDDVFLCPGIEDVVQLVCEFRKARTLYIKFKSGGAISMTQHDQREKDVIKLVCDALREEWKIIVDSNDFSDFSELLRFIAKPVFIVLDEIGAAFASDFATQDEQRNAFNSFVDTFGTHLMDHPGVYFILSGRADFLWNVGLNSEVGAGGGMTRETCATTRSKSPGIYERIHLNPIRTEHIDNILTCTVFPRRACSIATALRETMTDITQVTGKLYEITGGHPRSLLVNLSQNNPLQPLPDTEMGILFADVRRAVVVSFNHSKTCGGSKRLYRSDGNHQAPRNEVGQS